MADDSKGLVAANALGSSGTYALQAGRENKAKALEMSLKAKGHSDAEIEKASAQFEALLLHQMMNEMWKAVPNEGLLSGSREEALYRDMLNQAVADSISTGKSIGIKNVVMKELKAAEKK